MCWNYVFCPTELSFGLFHQRTTLLLVFFGTWTVFPEVYSLRWLAWTSLDEEPFCLVGPYRRVSSSSPYAIAVFGSHKIPPILYWEYLGSVTALKRFGIALPYASLCFLSLYPRHAPCPLNPCSLLTLDLVLLLTPLSESV